MDENIRQQLVGHFFNQIANHLASGPDTPMTAWLIERTNAGGDVLVPAQYIGEGRTLWTTDHLAAIRFARREDAERAIRLLRDVLSGDTAKATEHMWGL